MATSDLDRIIEDLRQKDFERNGPKRAARFCTIPGTLPDELARVLARMQAPKSRAGIEAAFRATPDELADAAVAAARRRRG
jgi:hypothetical protein